MPEHGLARIRALAPHDVLMIRCNDSAGRSGFVLRLTDLKFIVFRRTWHISGEVGGTGQGQIVSFYHAMKKLSGADLRTYGRPGGRILGVADFDQLFNGAIYPGSVIQPGENPWWDDFPDLEHKHFGADHYRERYGAGFLDAQEIVRWHLKEDNAAAEARAFAEGDGRPPGAA